LRTLRFLLPTILFIAIFTVTSRAAPSSPADTYVKTSAESTAFGTTDAANLQINSGGISPCDVTDTTYLRWSLAGINDVVGANTMLKLTVNDAPGTNTGSVSLYRVSDDTWNEATLTNSTPAPSVGALITSVSIPTSAPATVMFTGQDLADYLVESTTFVNGTTDTTVGNDIVSFAIRVSGCSGFSNPVRFDSKDGSGTAPSLELLDPLAITLATLTATPAATPLAPYAFLAAVIGLAALALVWMRRR
jgi:hypothetical protein